MSTLYEYYITNDDSYVDVYGALWRGQTFTPAEAHTIKSVKLLLWRLSTPGTLTVSIRATDVNGHPTGADLCSGTTNGNTLPTGSPYEWREITFGAGADLSASVKYAIVVSAIGGTGTKKVEWQYDASNSTYSGGCYEYSSNSGSTWSSITTRDCMFEEWGDPALVAKTSSDTGSGVDAIASGNPLAVLTGSETGVGIDAVLERATGEGFVPRRTAYDGYRCFIEQYVKNEEWGALPWKLPDGTKW